MWMAEICHHSFHLLLTQKTTLFSYITILWFQTFSLPNHFEIVWKYNSKICDNSIAWYGSSKTVNQGEWSIYLVTNEICNINLLIPVFHHWYVKILIIKHSSKIYAWIFFLFYDLSCWLVGYWIFKWRKTDKNITLTTCFRCILLYFWRSLRLTVSIFTYGTLTFTVRLIQCSYGIIVINSFYLMLDR
jgi:hypothetical protein